MQKLTIITINFNHKEGLRRTIDSIVHQTFTDYEWIVVDGGSTDGSKDMLEQYKDRFAWWCSEPDEGVYNAMNKGIAHATGEYINFMNSGDCFASPTVLEDFFRMPHSASIIFGIMAMGSIDGWKVNTPALKTHMSWWELYHKGFGHQSEFAKKELFDERMFDESYKITADWDWNAHFIAVKRVETEFVPMIVSVYEGGGLSDQQMERLLEERIEIRKRHFPSLRDDDMEAIKYVSIMNKFWLTRHLFYLLSRMTNRYLKIKAK